MKTRKGAVEWAEGETGYIGGLHDYLQSVLKHSQSRFTASLSWVIHQIHEVRRITLHLSF